MAKLKKCSKCKNRLSALMGRCSEVEVRYGHHSPTTLPMGYFDGRCSKYPKWLELVATHWGGDPKEQFIKVLNREDNGSTEEVFE